MRPNLVVPLSCALACLLWPGVPPAKGITVVAESPTYHGTWMPDQAANKKLARAIQKEMRQRMAERMRAQGGGKPPGGMPPGGKPPGGMGPGGMGAGGMGPPRGMGGSAADPLAMLSTTGMLRPEMDFAAPLEGGLQIEIDDERVVLGKAGQEGVALAFRGGSRELGGGESRAFAGHEQGHLVVEINTDDGVQVTHTYVLEGQGERLRIKTRVFSPDAPIPGGIPIERIFRRADAGAVEVSGIDSKQEAEGR
jgi:hypothetical protein